MKLIIENARTTFFNDKEHYLNFRKAWAEASNAPERMSTLERNDWGTYRKAGNLTAAHNFLYSLLRGKDALKGFTPVTNTNKLSNGAYINHGLYWAMSWLQFHIKKAN